MAWAAAAAIAVVLLLYRLNRRAAFAVLAAALVVGGVLWLVTEREERQSSALKEAITARAAADASACPDPGRPMMVKFHNGNDRPVARMSFGLTARLKGHSTISYRAFLRSDRVIEPGGTAVLCYGILPHGFVPPRPAVIDLSAYEWSVQISLVSFGD
nr:hypothetical protein REQ54_01637 [Rhizobium sp. Q54]